MTPAHSPKIDALDGFRGIAAIFVCVYHTPQYWGFAVHRAPMAVDLFFLLSGFVIGHSYDQRLATGRLTARTFALVRLIRLYPMYLISLLLVSSLYLIGLVIHHPHGTEHLAVEYSAAALAGLFVLPMKFSGDTVFFPLNIVYWSLFFELLCNFAYAALHPGLTNRVLLTTVAICAVVLIILVPLNGTIDLGAVWTWLSLSGGLVRSVLGIFGGLLMYRLRARIISSGLGPVHPVLPMILIALLLGSPSMGRWDWLLQLLTVFIVFPLCVAGVIPGPQTPRTTTSVGSRVMTLLGIASYPLYVLHVPLSHFLDTLSGKRLAEYSPFSGIFVLLLIIGVAIVVAQKLDTPIRRYLTARVFAERVPVPLAAHNP